MRRINLGQQVDGINRMRRKGGASPSGLFDLINGWVSPKGTVNARPGTALKTTLPLGTRGIFGFQGKFHTFHATVGSSTADYTVHVLRHPNGTAATLAKVHNVFAFLGRMYVVAEFSDTETKNGVVVPIVRHYWLELATADAEGKWVADAQLSMGQIVQPTTPNGYYYEVTGQFLDAFAIPIFPLAWQPNTKVVVAVSPTVRQPTVFNNFKYRVTSLTGPGTQAEWFTSNTEPVWPTTVGATVTERRYVSEDQVTPPPPTSTAPPTQPPPSGYGPYPPFREGERLPPTQDF